MHLFRSAFYQWSQVGESEPRDEAYAVAEDILRQAQHPTHTPDTRLDDFFSIVIQPRLIEHHHFIESESLSVLSRHKMRMRRNDYETSKEEKVREAMITVPSMEVLAILLEYFFPAGEVSFFALD